MLGAYSLNIEVEENSAIPFNSTSIRKGCTVTHPTSNTIELNKCGVYMVSCNASIDGAGTIQLYKDDVAQPQAQSTGTSPCFVTLVQVNHNNDCCACSSPVTLQVIALGGALTLLDANIVITKVV